MDAKAYGIVHFFPGGTQANYEAALAVVHPSEGLPEGQIFHTAGPSEGGWTIVAMHDSRQSWEAFRDNILLPNMEKGIEGGFESPPEERVFDVYRSTTL